MRIFNGIGLSKQWRWDEILVGVDRFGVNRCEEKRRQYTKMSDQVGPYSVQNNYPIATEH